MWTIQQNQIGFMCFVCCLFFLHVCNCEIVYHAQDIDRSFLWLILLDYVRSLRM